MYSGLNVQIEPLRINESDLNTKRMLDLMAVSQDDGAMPLYLHMVSRILRDMHIEQQETKTSFDYQSFKRRLMGTGMTSAQSGPLNQRLDTLESFMSKAQTGADQPYIRKVGSQGKEKGEGKESTVGKSGNNWTPKVCSTYTLFCINF